MKGHICTTGVIQIVQVGQYILILLTFLSLPSRALCTLYSVLFFFEDIVINIDKYINSFAQLGS
jgi:hypothetical protein